MEKAVVSVPPTLSNTKKLSFIFITIITIVSVAVVNTPCGGNGNTD